MEKRVVFAHSSDGVRIACSVEGSGFPLLSLSIPLMSNCRVPPPHDGWRRFAEITAKRHSIIRADLRGSGLADRRVSSHSLESNMADIESLLEATGVEQLDLMGWAARAPLAVRFAAEHPNRVRRLFLFGATAGNTAADGYALASAGFRSLVAQDWIGSVETVASRNSGSENVMPTLVPWMLQNCEQVDSIGFLECLSTSDIRADAVRLRCPTLVGELEQTTLRAPGHAERLAALIPRAEVAFLPNRERFEWMADFANAIAGFESRLDAAEPSANSSLSPRETEVVQLLAGGLRNDEIARRLSLSPSTIDRHIANIYAKAGVRNRAQATRWAIARRIVPPS